jgi:hypothetical protein
VLSLETGAMTLLARTEEVRTAAWSPDSRVIAFLSRGKLRKISSAGGNPQTIADISTISEEVSWGSKGEILYTPDVFAPEPSLEAGALAGWAALPRRAVQRNFPQR